MMSEIQIEKKMSVIKKEDIDSNFNPNIEYEIKPSGKFSININELWQYRELFYFFTLRDIKVKYKQAFLGVAWVVLQPLFMTFVFTLFFRRLLDSPTHSGMPYPIFVLSGMLFWNIFASGISSSGDSMVSNANIIKKIYFPRLVIPISAIMVSVLDFAIVLFPFIGATIYYGVSPNPIQFITYFPLGFIITILTTIGLGTLISALNVKFRDFRYIIPFLIQAGFFVTPIIFPTSKLPFTWAKNLLAINPLTGAIELSRASLVSSPVDWTIVGTSLISAILIFFIGLSVFRKTEAYFADLA